MRLVARFTEPIRAVAGEGGDEASVVLLTEADDPCPAWLDQTRAFSHLDLSRNNLGAVPDWLGQLTNLTSLNLGGNQLTTLPDWLGQLTNLTSLDLGFNQLAALPDWLGQLTNLTSLDLGGTQLTALPDWLGPGGSPSNTRVAPSVHLRRGPGRPYTLLR